MKKTFLISLLTLLPVMAFAQNSDTEKKQQALKEFKPYAKYFGFSDPEQYLNFANKMEMLMAGTFVVGTPLEEDPVYIAFNGIPYLTLSADQKQQVENMMQSRRQQLADALGVQVEKLESTMDSYLNYRDLAKSLYKFEQKKKGIVTTFSEDDEDEDETIEVIEIKAPKLNEWGGYGSIWMSIGLRDIAMGMGIQQLANFTVYFESRGTTQVFRYSNTAGAYYISSEKPVDKSCPTCDSPIILE